MQNRTIRRRLLGATLIPMAALAVAAARPETTEASAARRDSLRLHADVSSRTLTLYSNGSVVRSYPIAVGTPSDPTPRGTFRIRKLVWNPGWVPPDERWARGRTAKAPGQRGNPMKVVKIFFREPDYYIHGTGATESLGSAASHGCLRMAPAQAAEVGQYLMDHGGSPRPESWFRRVLRFRSETKVIYLDNPITLEITS
jgi:lipoprotein-anchoring transpeptidase ErfK/SrfK